MTSFRLDRGGLIDRTRPLSFTFDGRKLSGFAGDTLASALLANGIRLVGRSFKLHRPRGIVSAGPEEPNALVRLDAFGRHTPNMSATTVELVDGLVAASQNAWPSLRFDALALNDRLSRFLGAGFYYKSFMWPASFWEKVYEPAIRHAAGLGVIAMSPDDMTYAHVHHHCDVLVIGSGPAGLVAARMATEAGARVLLCEQDTSLGGGTLVDPALAAWRALMIDAIDPGVQLARTTVTAAFDHGVYLAIERHVNTPRLHVIRTQHAIHATGASERLIAFPGNDVPGVLLAGAAQAYAQRFGVAVGRRVVVFANNDGAYDAAHALAAHGIEIAAIVDPRVRSHAADAAVAAGMRVLCGHEVSGTRGRMALTHVWVRRVGGGGEQLLAATALIMSGGYDPNAQLASQARVPLGWREDILAFAPTATARVHPAGACAGVFGAHAVAVDAARASHHVLTALGRVGRDVDYPPADPRQQTPPQAIWHVRAPGKAFVDLQHDVTVDDVRMAHQEGYSHVEHMKRYTTHGMATDQGRIGGLVGSAVLADARGVTIAAVGLPTFRPYVGGARWGALAGPDVGRHFKPERRLPLHDWHAAHGAVFVCVGLWMRPLVYSATGDMSWGPVLREARNVRRAVGLSDASSLGKIDVQGPDAATFLDRMYANTISTLPVGHVRYSLMLREDGMVFDDGTAARLGATHFLVTTTTQKADDVLAHMEWYRDTVWPDLDVVMTNVADHWAQFAVAGPMARQVLDAAGVHVKGGLEAVPFMGYAEMMMSGVQGRLFRISFSGERAYEIAVPSRQAVPVWQRLLDAGAPFGIMPYGLDALNVLRIEKGHVTGAEINGQTTAADLGLEKLLKKRGDFVGRALSLRDGLLDPMRLQLVGLRPLGPNQRIRGGAQLIADGNKVSQGYVTSPCMAAEHDGWLALALLAGGKRRRGEQLIAASPVFDESVAVEVTNPHWFDPENTRVRA